MGGSLANTEGSQGRQVSRFRVRVWAFLSREAGRLNRYIHKSLGVFAEKKCAPRVPPSTAILAFWRCPQATPNIWQWGPVDWHYMRFQALFAGSMNISITSQKNNAKHPSPTPP